MKLLIDAQGGMAGDMFSAALVSAGADFKFLQEAMLAAGRELGSARIEITTTPDGASQLAINLDSTRHHLGGYEAREILAGLFDRFDIREKYRTLGMKILEILTKAEIRAHKEFNIVIEGDHSHHHHQHDVHEHHDHEHHDHEHHDHEHHDHEHHDHKHHDDKHHDDHQSHHRHHKEEAFLHEAQDIVIDIMGTVAGMQLLDIEPAAGLSAPVSVGGGHVHCSHGTLAVPAPATSIILEQYGLPWKKGPIERELFTPTGAAILAALAPGTGIMDAVAIENLDVKAIGISRGAKILAVPPLKLLLY